jgi:uncharacterized protein with HEPN domain
MTQHDPQLALQHMLDYAREAVAMTAGRTREQLQGNRQLQLALVRLLEVIGEAASRLPGELRRRHPAVPWQDIIDMRNRLIHGYDSVDLAIVWQVIRVDLPVLIPQLEAIDAASSERMR